jgi:TRAP-type C4-dicarboxylate transport system permease small subunit
MSTHQPADTPACTLCRPWRQVYGRFLEILVFALMVILFIEVTLGVVFRTLGHSLSWYDEVASILLAWLTFYGSALASFKRAHMGCPELIETLAPLPKKLLAVLAQLLVIGFFLAMAIVGFQIMPILATDTMTSLPDIPMSVVQSVIPISSVLILVSEFDELVRILSSSGQNAQSSH